MCTREYIKRSARQRICAVCRAKAPHRSVAHILEHGLDTPERLGLVKVCALCGAEFETKAANQKICEDCRAQDPSRSVEEILRRRDRRVAKRVGRPQGVPADGPRRLQLPDADVVDDDLEPEELDEVPELDGPEADNDVDVVSAPAPPLRGHDEPRRITYPERACSTPSCRRLFQPTHPAQKSCPRCRGFRVTEEPKGADGGSWWTKTTSREDFQKRAAGREDEMRHSKENARLGIKILGE